MADSTNAGTPQAGGQLSGEVTRQAAVRRLEKEQAPKIRKQQTAGPNTGATGLAKVGSGLKQEPGNPSYSPHPPKPRRI
jgi:hypothetical protein